MKTYSEKLRDPRWQKKRLAVMDRDRFTCRDCGANDQTLHVHHCHYEKGEPWNTGENFLLTLCESCHEARGELEADAKRALAILLANLSHRSGNNQLCEFVTSLIHAKDMEAPMIIEEAQCQDLWRKANEKHGAAL